MVSRRIWSRFCRKLRMNRSFIFRCSPHSFPCSAKPDTRSIPGSACGACWRSPTGSNIRATIPSPSGQVTPKNWCGCTRMEVLPARARYSLIAACLAAIGNVYTRRDRRGLGFGTQVTAAVTAALLRLRLRTVALNVEQNNDTAIRIYERLGFRRYCEYREGVARRAPVIAEGDVRLKTPSE
jgi:hypothetical protein